MDKIEIILPECSDDLISNGLRVITEAIALNDGTVSGGLLGGEFGYGGYVDNDIFMMHPYCWCEKDDCPWCGEEHAPNFHHKPTGLMIWWYKYIGRGMIIAGSKTKWNEILIECINSLKQQ